MRVYFYHPFYEYAHSHTTFGWKGIFGGKLFWRYGLPDLLERTIFFEMKISRHYVFSIPGIYVRWG